MNPKAAAKSVKNRGQWWQALMLVEAISMFACGYEAQVLKRYVMKAIKTKPIVIEASLCKGTTSFTTSISSGLSLVIPFQTR